MADQVPPGAEAEAFDLERVVREALQNLPGAGGGGMVVPHLIPHHPTSGELDPFSYVADAFTAKPDYFNDLTLWAEHRLGEHLWSKQQEIALSLRDHRYTAVQSCHGVGKSHIASRAIANWIDRHAPGDAFVVSTAPTSAQVKAILWREISRAHKKGSLPGRIAMGGYPEWKMNDGELVGYGRKPADYSESAFQGIHSRYPLIVMDEACGIDRHLFDAVDALATNEDARVLAIGNPDDPSSFFAQVCKPDSGWNVIRIDGLTSPNITAEALAELPSKCHQCATRGREVSLLQTLMAEEGILPSEEQVPDDLRPMLISALWIEERLHRWVGDPGPTSTISLASKESALFTAKVRGLFPESSTEGVIPLGWVEAAITRHKEWVERGQPLPNARLVVGADIARSGTDETAVARRRGDIVMDIRRHRYADTMKTTAVISALVQNEPYSEAVVDVIGVGAGVLDRGRELGLPFTPFNAAASARGLFDRSREFGFVNMRAAAWWNLRELLDPSRGAVLMLPDSDLLRADLTAPRWTYRTGKPPLIQIESKDDIKKRLGRSTDEGDAVVQSMWIDSEAAENYRESANTVSWWQGVEPGESLRWVEPDAVENWVVSRENQEDEPQWLTL